MVVTPMQINSSRASLQHGTGFELLRTQVEGKEILVHVACSFSGISVAPRDCLPDAVLCISRVNDVKALLLKELVAAEPGCSLLVACGDSHIQQEVLSVLGAVPREGYFTA